MKTLYLTCGLPGSGKTTYVNAHLAPKGVQVVCPDNLRLAYGHSFYGPIEPHIHAQVYLTVRAQMYRGLDVVVDECHVRADHLKRWRRLADEMGYEMKLIRFSVPAEDCKNAAPRRTPTSRWRSSTAWRTVSARTGATSPPCSGGRSSRSSPTAKRGRRSMIRLPQSYDEGFCSLLERLRSTYPAELFRLEGIHPDQLDINAVSRDYFKTSDRKGSATADHSIDPNANVSGRDVITFNYEVPKSLMKLNSLYNLWKTMKELYGRDDADQAIEYEINGTLYINDVWDIGRPYCFNYSTYDIALEGLKMGGRLNIDPPKSLNAFLRQVEQFTVYAANSTLGATGLADLLIVVSRYVDDILTTGYDHHVKIGKAPRVWTYVKESLTSLIYTLNWEFRGNQSPFTNVSVYDRHFLRQLVPAYLIGGTAPDIETVEKVQDLFLDAYNETLARTPITFPVVTACFSAAQGSDGGGRTIQDKAFLKKIARHNLKYGFINIYCGESSTLSSCCRLRSSISDLGYSNTFGAGSTKIGSLGVVTLNLPRWPGHRRAAVSPAFLGLLRQSTGTASRINHAKRMFIQGPHRTRLPPAVFALVHGPFPPVFHLRLHGAP